MENENTATKNAEMTEKLKKSAEKVEKEQAQRRERTVKGAHLLGALRKLVLDAGLTETENTGFYVVRGAAGKTRTVYIAKKGGRVDLNGFTVEHAGVTQVTEEEAKKKHLGKVRGVLDFDQSDEVVLAAFGEALAALAEVQEEAPKPAAKPKKAKASDEEPKETEAPTETAEETAGEGPTAA
jgi:hypothetical protein